MFYCNRKLQSTEGGVTKGANRGAAPAKRPFLRSENGKKDANNPFYRTDPKIFWKTGELSCDWKKSCVILVLPLRKILDRKEETDTASLLCPQCGGRIGSCTQPCPVCGCAKERIQKALLQHFKFSFRKSDGALVVRKYRGKAQDVVIPDGVNVIGSEAFYCKALTSVTLPATVTTIEEDAFGGCEALTEIAIPAGVTEIGDRAFQGCGALERISVSDDNPVYRSENNCLIERKTGRLILGCGRSVVPDGVTAVGKNAFCFCRTLTSLSLPDSVTVIEGSAFFGCQNLKKVSLPAGLTKIGSHAFNRCEALAEIALPAGLTKIGMSAFGGCNALRSIAIQAGVKRIGRVAFDVCGALESIVVADDNPVYRSENNCLIERKTGMLLRGCGNSVVPAGVTGIDTSAFSRCASLTHVLLPDSVTVIGMGAFFGCSGLEDLVIPQGVTKIGFGAFSDCEKLKRVTILGRETDIGEEAFSDCVSLTSVLLPDGVVRIGKSAFWGCSSLAEISIPAGVTAIGDCAFFNCQALQTVSVAESNPVYRSENNCLIERETGKLILGCDNGVVPDGVTSIGSYAFNYRTTLTEIVIPVSVTKIDPRAFFRCTSLRAVIYRGTKAQWASVCPEDKVYVRTVRCTDGEAAPLRLTQKKER